MQTGETGCGSNKVVGLPMRALDMKHPAIAQVEAYWEALRGNRNVPLRSEIDPRGIDQALENAFILERIAPSVARFRLAGMHLNDLMGMEVRGMPVTSLFTGDSRTKLTDTLEHLFEEPAKVLLRLTGEHAAGRGKISGEMLLLPLRSDLGDISRAIGCLVSDGRIGGKSPLRFNISGAEITPLSGVSRGTRSSNVYKAPDEVIAPAQAALQEEAKEYQVAPSNEDVDPNVAKRPAYLRLVHDNT